MAPSHLVHHHCFLQMETASSLTDLKSWTDGLNTSRLSSNINDEAINRLKQTPFNIALADPPQPSEVKKAISKLSSGKANGQDCIPAEIYASGSPLLIDKLTELFCEMWKQERIPQELKDTSIIHLYKKKGNRQSCDNHRGISLLSIAGQSATKQTTKAP